MSTQLFQKFPFFKPEMTLAQEVQTVNDMRLGMFTNDMDVTEVNKNLDELLPTLSDSEVTNFLLNISLAYQKTKFWAEKQRKTQIALSVDEVEKAKQALANKKREKKEKKDAKKKEVVFTSNGATVKNVGKVAICYDSNPATNKAIKEFVSMTGSYSSAVAMLKSIGGLPSDYELNPEVK